MTPRTSRAQMLHSGLPQVRQYAIAGTSTWLAQFIRFSCSAGPDSLRFDCGRGLSQYWLVPADCHTVCTPFGCWFSLFVGFFGVCGSSVFLLRAGRRGADRAPATRSRKPGACSRNSAPRAPGWRSTSSDSLGAQVHVLQIGDVEAGNAQQHGDGEERHAERHGKTRRRHRSKDRSQTRPSACPTSPHPLRPPARACSEAALRWSAPGCCAPGCAAARLRPAPSASACRPRLLRTRLRQDGQLCW